MDRAENRHGESRLEGFLSGEEVGIAFRNPGRDMEGGTALLEAQIRIRSGDDLRVALPG